MTEGKRKLKASGPRTEVFAMRMDPKLKYLAEIAARKQRRSLASFIEWVIEQALNRVVLHDDYQTGEKTVYGAAMQLWAPDESDRLIRLASNFPDLLTYEEELIWRVINEYYAVSEPTHSIVKFTFENKEPKLELIRSCWKEIKRYALEGGPDDDLREALLQQHSHPPYKNLSD